MEGNEPFTKLEEDSAQYVAGYIFNRFSSIYPDLIKQNKDDNELLD